MAGSSVEVEGKTMKPRVSELFWKYWMPVANRAAKGYVAGAELDDALRVSRELNARSLRATVCYWNPQEDSPREVANAYLSALDAFEREKADWYLSIKAPALEFSLPLVDELVGRCKQLRVRAHFDAHGPETADATFRMIEHALAGTNSDNGSSAFLGCTLPGRWRRSLRDADWAIKAGLNVRVVKGQWKDSDDADRDLRRGYLEIIEHLAGRARHVAVATHDPLVVSPALDMLVASGTPCELELLYGLPFSPAIDLARQREIPVRVYIPYGHGWLPYCLSQARKNPRILWWLLRDLLFDKFPWNRIHSVQG